MSTTSHILLAIIGVGGVGKAVIDQLQLLAGLAGLQPKIIFLARSSVQLYNSSYTTIDPSLLSTSTCPNLNLTQLKSYLCSAPKPSKVVLIDNTSNQDVADFYANFLSSGISIITPNKKAFSSSTQCWNSIVSASYPCNPMGGLVYHESTVGAGLPIISTMKDLISTGDDVRKVEGIFSGTMSFLFNQYQPINDDSNPKWSVIVKQAKSAGYTEPDPRDDLNGMDVARKCTILARLAGLSVESPTSFPVQSLVPSALSSASSAEQFMNDLPKYDDEMESYRQSARAAGMVIRFVGSVDVERGKIEVGLKLVEKTSPIALLKGSDNLYCFYTKRYGEKPLVVQGAGAGNEVTAMGVTGDLIKCIQRLGN